MSGLSGELGKEMYTRLIGQFGSKTEVVLTALPAATFDIISQERTDGVPVVTPLNAMVSEYDDSEIDDTVILEGDLKVDVDGAVVIDKTMTITIDGGVYRIQNIKRVKPAAVVVGYQLQVRR